VARVALHGLLAGTLISPSFAAPTYPAQEWQKVDPAAAGWSMDRLRAAQDYAEKLGTTAVMIVQHGRVVASWGDVSQRVRVNSVRKSFLSALYGMAIAEGRIDPTATLETLGIEDKAPGLTPAEKQARVRDLLMARSGVYHEAASEPARMKDRRPERGSHPPDTYWYYNNWDFNALGTIYRQRTGEDIFAAIEKKIARPLGMQDFTAKDGKYVYAKASNHPAYHLDMSARDLARFGWLFLNKGRWGDRQVVPTTWVAESTRAYSDASYLKNTGYGYMWWVAKGGKHRGARVGEGAFSARGYGGQFILVSPADDLVVVLLHAKHVTNRQEGQLLKRITAATPQARSISARVANGGW